MKKIKKNLDNYLDVETIDTGETFYLEEELYVDENSIKNKSLVRFDINIVQFPIFSKNTKKRKNEITTYYFNKNRDTFITVTPSAGEYIPGETEEIVFIALMSIMKKNGMQQEFYTTSSEIKAEAKIHSKNYGSIIKSSLARLSSTNYIFKNTMYSSDSKGILSEEVNTSILSFRAQSLLDKKFQYLRNEFNDKRIKEAYWIKISDHFYNNMIKKGYLVYDSNLLLDINSSVARTIYMLIEKLRFNKAKLRIDTVFLIKRIPLKFEKRNLHQTVKTLEAAFEELKNKELIQNFKFLKETTWEKSEIEIDFSEVVILDKQERFFEDFNDFRSLSTDMTISDTEHEIIEQEIQDLKSKIETLDMTSEIVEKLKDEETEEEILELKDVTVEMIREVFELLPSVAKKLKSMPKTIQDSIPKYGLNSVRMAAIYLSKQKNLKSPRAYFLKSLEQKWYEDLAEIVKKPKKGILEPSSTILENGFDPSNVESQKSKYSENIFNEFQKLDEKVRNGIESYAYREYIARCGAETKVQKLAFLAGRKSIITDFLIKYPRILSGGESENLNSKDINSKIEEAEAGDTLEKTPLNDIAKLNEFINKTIEVYRVVLNLSDEKILEIKREIVNELIEKFLNNSLTLEEIKSIIYKKVM
ncbi:MAG: hypothetical protein ACRDB6_09180 [Cetobacterium sp.]